MTINQINAIEQARGKIREIRELLDGVMYYSEPITKEEYKRVREAYDLVCKANDAL